MNGKKIMMHFIVKIILYGILVWLVPFVIAIPFYSPEGILLVDEHLFKTVMILSGGGTGAILLVLLFRDIKQDYVKKGVIIGLVWLVINWLLDIGILFPLSGMDVSTYLNQIGLRYFMIPIMSIMAGYIAYTATKNHI